MLRRPYERLVELNQNECLWPYVLRILYDAPTHAYTIRNEIKKRYKFEPGTVTAYKVLYFLDAEGYVKGKLQDRRVVYKITKKGINLLKNSAKFYKQQFNTLKI